MLNNALAAIVLAAVILTGCEPVDRCQVGGCPCLELCREPFGGSFPNEVQGKRCLPVEDLDNGPWASFDRTEAPQCEDQIFASGDPERWGAVVLLDDGGYCTMTQEQVNNFGSTEGQNHRCFYPLNEGDASSE